MKKIFKKDITVSQDDLDNLNHVNNVRYVQWIEDAIKDHWVAHASEDLKKDYFWIVLNHNISYKTPAFLGDTVKFRIEVLAVGAATSDCLVEIYHAETGKILVSAETRWCLLDSKTLRPRRITEEMKPIFIEEEVLNGMNT